MKTSTEWAKEIIAFLQANPVDGIVGATVQIEQIVSWVQKDALASNPVESIRMQ